MGEHERFADDGTLMGTIEPYPWGSGWWVLLEGVPPVVGSRRLGGTVYAPFAATIGEAEAKLKKLFDHRKELRREARKAEKRVARARAG